MTFALTRFEAYGVQIDQPLSKRYIQRVEMRITGANTDIAVDLGNLAGTFWTAVGSTEPGTTALAAIKAIALKAASLVHVGGSEVTNKCRVAGTASAGQYNMTVTNDRPNITYVTTDAPTSQKLVLEWELKDGEAPVKVLKTA